MKFRGAYIGLGIIAAGIFLQGLSQVAKYHQWVIDRAYNKGRIMERLCSKEPIQDVCERHNQNTGHSVEAAPD